MDDAYPDDIYQGDRYDAPEPKKGPSGWLIALIVLIVLIVGCCICLLLAVLLVGPAMGNTFSTIIETVEATTPMP